ncbi:hypothetical protein F0562_010574 [Nyssa sinensis]|uniref:Bulb-type lectin domain-containing protein n=1 Tax=Nyssa sinensis TaxID=561372 RepID=A0A5J4ZYT8_9ASTE|nr:hypothetical protein F0562_010574 [Nyssa sinensis]
MALLFLSLLFLLFSSISQASVPPANQFKFVNEPDFGDYVVEYDASYHVLSVFNSPFQLAFYNTTPNAFTLALRMGLVRSESLLRWVWEANRGNPVRQNATLTFGSDGNLVLADADGRVAWQTGTANKGVVKFELLPNGNMVLLDSNGKFVWQSFDYPTDTLLVGQSLRAGAASKLVSRASERDNSNGPYSLELEPKRLAMYYKSKNSPKPLLYFSSSELFTISKGNLENLTFSCEEMDNGFSYYLLFDYTVKNPSSTGNRYLARARYNGTLTFLRLGIDGNIRFYTYNDNVDIGAWEVTYALFDRDSTESECQLPGRCGEFGLCEDNQCVACPKPNGLVGWSKDCKPMAVTSCKVNDFYYYKLQGVDHFMSKFTAGDGPVKENDCGTKCTMDCKCLGYFYHQDTSSAEMYVLVDNKMNVTKLVLFLFGVEMYVMVDNKMSVT